MNRLVGSGEELHRVAQVWGAQGTLLEGARASRSAFLRAIADTQPASVHLATHAVQMDSRRDQVYLAFSIGEAGRPELLGTSDIAMLKVPGALVVMSGCSSGSGEARPGAGLLGLTRAWLSAGARAVVATGWPVEDSHGDLLPAFYKHLSSRSFSTAEALRRGQLEMIHSGTWQADPAYWAAFQLTGGVR
jgi:CHAT domain-containing protein